MFITKRALEKRIQEAVMKERERLEEREWINRRFRDMDEVFSGLSKRINEVSDHAYALEARMNAGSKEA